jgi:hypothetical protein
MKATSDPNPRRCFPQDVLHQALDLLGRGIVIAVVMPGKAFYDGLFAEPRKHALVPPGGLFQKVIIVKLDGLAVQVRHVRHEVSLEPCEVE